jgi:putative DNA primase/helicase
MSGSSDRIYLAVPYEERDQAKALGARWDREAKSWCVPAEKNSDAFGRWRPGMTPGVTADQDPRKQFADELRKAGFKVDGQHPIMDGKIHRIPVAGDKGVEKNGSYRGFLDGRSNGWFQNFKAMQEPQKWKAGQQLTDAERTDLVAVSATNRRAAEEARQKEASIASQKAIEILAAASPATSHAYLTEKQVRSHGLFIASPGTSIETESGREIDITGRLLVPIRNAGGIVVSLQIIDDQGGKMFLRGGKVAGGQHVIGDAKSPWPLLIAEGYATAATVHEATRRAVAVAFNAHNLGLVAAQHRAAAPDRSIFIAGDDDSHLSRNVGREAATAAASAIGGTALIPEKAGDRGTDWNDAMKARGMDAVRAELSDGLTRATKQKIAQLMQRARRSDQQRERVRDEVER